MRRVLGVLVVSGLTGGAAFASELEQRVVVRAVDARSGKPIAGAALVGRRVAGGRGARWPQGCESGGLEWPEKLPETNLANGVVVVRSGEDGRLEIPPAMFKALLPPPYHCPPGAPCAAPPVEKGQAHTGRSYGAPAAGCKELGGDFTLQTFVGEANPKAPSCSFRHCRRVE